MRRLYFVFRIGGYAAGLLGLGLFLAGRRIAPPHPALTAAGGILIIAGFASFVCSYGIYLLVRFDPRNRH